VWDRYGSQISTVLAITKHSTNFHRRRQLQGIWIDIGEALATWFTSRTMSQEVDFKEDWMMEDDEDCEEWIRENESFSWQQQAQEVQVRAILQESRWLLVAQHFLGSHYQWLHRRLAFTSSLTRIDWTTKTRNLCKTNLVSALGQACRAYFDKSDHPLLPSKIEFSVSGTELNIHLSRGLVIQTRTCSPRGQDYSILFPRTSFNHSLFPWCLNSQGLKCSMMSQSRMCWTCDRLPDFQSWKRCR